MTSKAVHKVSKFVSWWLERSADGWHYNVAGQNWTRRSVAFPTQYEAQRQALLVFAAA